MISFEFDSGGPSRIEAWLPAVSAGSGAAAIWQPDSELTGMEAHIEEKQFDRMVYLQNKAPKWDEAHGGHVLNFQVRYFPLAFLVIYFAVERHSWLRADIGGCGCDC